MLEAKTPAHNNRSRFENRETQALKEWKVFNNSEVLAEGWYPVLRSRALARGKVQSVLVHKQRLAVYRSESGEVKAVDAFCPHMGADLGNGRVKGENLQCYFHQWEFSGDGQLCATPCKTYSAGSVQTSAYKTQEAYGFIWIFLGDMDTEFVVPMGLEKQKTHALSMGRHRLYAHHHVMMATGVDLMHFRSVHGIDIQFDYQVSETSPQVWDWELTGAIPNRGWRGRLGRLFIGDTFTYRVRVGSGAMVAVTYGKDQRLFGRGPKLPEIHLVWGAIPRVGEPSDVQVFSVVPASHGLKGFFSRSLRHGVTLLLLTILRDDDVKAFPNMRFQLGKLTAGDRAVVDMAKVIDRVPVFGAKGGEA